MSTLRTRLGLALGAAAVTTLVLAGCASGNDPLQGGSTADPAASGDAGAGGAIVIGSQAYYSNEIIAEIYALALEDAGLEVDRQFSIGQRDAYIPSLEDGSIDLFPEYTGNLLQFFDAEATATSAEDVYAALQEVLPDGLVALDQASATDQDSYNVTAEFAAENDLTTIADLANVDGTLTLGGAPELEERPYGPSGLSSVYGVDVEFQATGDTTVAELVAGSIQIANVYSADPRIETDNLVTLEDPEGLFLASNVVPIASADLDPAAVEVINEVSAALTPEGLVALNVQSQVDQLSTDDIAAAWIAENLG